MSDIDQFWHWCLTVWRKPGLDGQLLALQDGHDVVILELLFCAWLAQRGRVLTEAELSALHNAAKPWVEGVVVPLRQQRVVWREHPAGADYRAAIKPLELQAERALAELLISAAQALNVLASGTSCAEGRAEALSQNINHCLALATPRPDVTVSAHLAELLHAEGGPST